MSLGSSAESYPAFALNGLRENPEKTTTGNSCKPGFKPGPAHFTVRHANRYSTAVDGMNLQVDFGVRGHNNDLSHQFPPSGSLLQHNLSAPHLGCPKKHSASPCSMMVGSSPVTHAASLGYQILPHPPYSPDMAPSDFFLFPRMKNPLRGKHFQNDEEVIFEVERFLNSQNADFYNQGLHQVIHCWEKCVALKGEYVEKD
ncbi:hypothetical protein ANN_10086 [Periplaneta americana]|uniref:Histone-lysine N-methyltransferase SETMAR n=1 Tax=Periplaneta americana TaxID=6978 RepID=A0ABQ8TN27_PERAM|nr:hypothetical protein ANN_10086 [Periplaneta americana]